MAEVFFFSGNGRQRRCRKSIADTYKTLEIREKRISRKETELFERIPKTLKLWSAGGAIWAFEIPRKSQGWISKTIRPNSREDNVVKSPMLGLGPRGRQWGPEPPEPISRPSANFTKMNQEHYKITFAERPTFIHGHGASGDRIIISNRPADMAESLSYHYEKQSEWLL